MKKFMILITALFVLAGCKSEEYPEIWADHLDPYMAEYGYTIAEDGVTILKNDHPVWKDEPCFGRACNSNQPLVPMELRLSVMQDFAAALAAAEAAHIADISARIGIEPTATNSLDPLGN